MKNLSILILSFLSFHSIAGDAFVSKFTRGSAGSWCVSVSNVGNINTEVVIIAFLSNGQTYNGSSSTDGVPSQFNHPFYLEPNKTSLLCVNNVSGPTEHGYARISGNPVSNSVNDKSYLIATAYWVTSSRQMHIPVNNGLPF